FRIKRDPAKLLGSAVAWSTLTLGGCVDYIGCELEPFWRIEVMIRTLFVLNLVVIVLSLTGTTGELQAQVPRPTGHEHLTEVGCVDVPPGEKRPEFGCFNIGTVKELHFR